MTDGLKLLMQAGYRFIRMEAGDALYQGTFNGGEKHLRELYVLSTSIDSAVGKALRSGFNPVENARVCEYKDVPEFVELGGAIHQLITQRGELDTKGVEAVIINNAWDGVLVKKSFLGKGNVQHQQGVHHEDKD